MLGYCQLLSRGAIESGTDLPPLTLAVVVLEQTLVEGDTVLAEHETEDKQDELASAHVKNESSLRFVAPPIAIDQLRCLLKTASRISRHPRIGRGAGPVTFGFIGV